MTTATPTVNTAADVETIIIGAGVVGLATAAGLAREGLNVVVLEQEKSIGQGISARNSEVIHAGIYYPRNSLKAKLCVSGRELLYKYCDERNIPCQRIGKLIVATDPNEIEILQGLRQKALDNGVVDIEVVKPEDAMAMQPGLHCVAALLSPSTGIIDSHSLMLSLQAEIESYQGDVVCNTRAVSIDHKDKLFCVKLSDGTTVTAKNVVNSTGLNSVPLAKSISSINNQNLPIAKYAKGNYFKLAVRAPFSKLIYPAPVPGGLGIHLTIDLAGQKRFGPDVEWLSNTCPDEIDYQVNPQRGDDFYEAIRRYWPDLPDDSLVPDYAGVRPKIEWNNRADVDFEIHTQHHHGIPGLVNLFGIESPGLTASLAIAEHVCNTIQ